MGRSIFGFEVKSELPFRFLRPGTSEDALIVDEAPSEWMAQRDEPIHRWTLKDATGDVSGTLHRSDSLYHVWFADAGWYRIDTAARHITIPREADPVVRELRAWSVPTTLCSVERGDLSLHAAAVDVGGAAVLLAAPGQHGKTTLALAFHSCGYRVLTEDVACCRLDSTPSLAPGPASLRVRPDMFTGAAAAGTLIEAHRADRVFIRIDETRAGSADAIPIRAVVFLHEDKNEIRLEAVEKARALPDLYALAFRVGGAESAAAAFSRIGRFAATTPIYTLYRPLRPDNLDTVVARIAELVRP